MHKCRFYSLIILLFCLVFVFQLWSLILSVHYLGFNACISFFIADSDIRHRYQHIKLEGLKILCTPISTPLLQTFFYPCTQNGVRFNIPFSP